MNVETKNLIQHLKNKTFVDVYTDAYEESYYGFIVDFNDVFLVLDSYDDDSNADGHIVLFRDHITRIRWGGNEISSAFKLIDQTKILNKKIDFDLSSIQNIIRSINNSYGYINISIQDIDSDICFIGEVNDIDEETLVINEYGTKTSLDRKNIMISVNNITKVEAGGQYEEGLKKIIL